MTVLELRELAVDQVEQARALKEKIDAEGRGSTADEAADMEKLMREAERLEAEANRQEKLEAIEARLNKPQETKTKPELSDGKRIETPANNRFRFGQLRAFKGPKADEDAYTAGRWLLATVMDDAASRQWCRDRGVQMRVQTEGVNAAGGFLVPDVMERAIIDLRETYGMFRREARIVPMSSDHSLIPRRVGGVDAYFVGETDDITASDKSWNQVELTAKKLGALTRMSTDLAEDAIINIADDLADEMAFAFSKKEDQCGIDGDGTGTYGGMLGFRTVFMDGFHTAGSHEATSPATAWSHLTLADEITTLLGLLPTYAMARAKWYIHPAGKAGLFDAVSLNLSGNRISDLAAGTTPMFAGYPVVLTSIMPSVPTDQSVIAILGDLSMSSTIGDRRGITIKVSTDRYLEYDQIGIQATERFCIVNHDLGDNTDAGPIVALYGNT